MITASWREEEFFGFRVALTAASALGWVLWVAEPLSELRAGADATFVLWRIGGGLLCALLTHLGLFISLRLERSDWVLRVFAAVVMLPNILFAGLGAAFAITEPFVAEYAIATCSLLLLHVVQLWRLGGLAFPRVERLALSAE